MLTLLKKLFGKSEPKAPAPIPVAAPQPSTPMPAVEVAHLSLATITARLSDDVKSLLVKEPDPAATVALPLQTILKQLPAGCVKMSLGTLARQAQGVIRPLPPGDKRTVDVPLAEVFRHIRLSSLKRRPDQRPIFVPETGFNLFGNAANPYAVSPDDHLEETNLLDLTPDATVESVQDAPRVLKMDDGLRAHFGATAGARSATPAPALKLELTPSGPRIATGPALVLDEEEPPVPAPAPVRKRGGPTLAVALAPLAAHWPDDIRAEIAAFDPETTVALPVNEVGAGLSKGRVTFSWAEIHAWLAPHAAPSRAAGSTALSLPLKIVAPAFLSASKKPATERKSVEVDANIPALFNDGRVPEPTPPPEAEPPTPAPEATPEPVAPAAAPQPRKIPETIGEVFGQPHKRDWTPAEIVAGAVKLPGVAGAVVALQEGLQVAASLPDGVKSDVVAAFLPQIFARLNQYSNEMKLGDVDDLLFTTHGAHCQIYRLGYIYLAVLGKPGDSLPWHELRLISEELARQTHQ